MRGNRKRFIVTRDYHHHLAFGKRGPIVPSTPPQIDGRHFINPVFENVTPEYNGTGSVEMDNAKFIGTIRAYSTNNAVMQALATAPPRSPGTMAVGVLDSHP
jgi:hypothetical protein